jgi:hypothetical protein
MLEQTVYDFETSPDRVILGIKARGGPAEHLVIDEPADSDTAAEIAARLSDREVAGYNNTGFDTYLLNAVYAGASPRHLHEIGQDIINFKGPAWKVAQQHGLDRSGHNELDLMHYTPRGRLKQYEGRMGLAIKDLPFDPHATISDDLLPVVVAYLEHDLFATERLRMEVDGDVQARLLLEHMFSVDGLTKKTAANVAASIIVSEYTRDSIDVEVRDIKAAANKKRNCAFDFYVPLWVRDVIKGTLAEAIADQIDGTEFHIVEGVRQAPSRKWPELINLSEDDSLEAAFGLGGIHTKDESCNYSSVSFDVASLYPHIIMHPDCSPSHLDEQQFHAIYGRLIKRRLEAKNAKDKATSNALKLVLNSCFGAYNFPYSLLYSPDAFLSITVCGQLCLLALAERTKQRINQGVLAHV